MHNLCVTLMSGARLSGRMAGARIRAKVNEGFACILVVLLTVQTWAGEAPAAAGQSRSDAFDREVAGIAELLRLPGLAVAVVRDGTIIRNLRLGFADVESKRPLTDESIFWLASITKSFSAVMLMQYQQEGRITLDDAVIEYPFASVGFFPQRIDGRVRLKHVLSHTTEGTPGTEFVYNGGRYNFIYGVIEEMSGLKYPESYTRELESRIFHPLGLKGTLAGVPGTNQSSLRERIVTPYVYDSAQQRFRVNRGALNPGTAYPGTGLLSCVKDLASYTTALDENRLLTEESYRQMTSPFLLNGGQLSRYGFGWFTTEVAGVDLHWAYGLGDADSAILVRVPKRKLSLIVLCNSSFATEASWLGAGNPATSPFIVAFLKHFIFEREVRAIDYAADPATIRNQLEKSVAQDPHPIGSAELLSQALTRTFVESTFKTDLRQGAALTRLLYDVDKTLFTRQDPAIFHLLAQHTGSDLDDAAELAVGSYLSTGRFHPWILMSISKRFEAKGDRERALRFYRRLADYSGFDEAGETIHACRVLARDYANEGDFEKAREYFWRALIFTRQRGGDGASILEEITQWNTVAKEKKKQQGSR